MGAPLEYIEMKFCERFHLKPWELDEFEYGQFVLWLEMLSIEAKIEEQRYAKR